MAKVSISVDMPALGSTLRLASRDESRARMRETEQLLMVAGKHPTAVEHELVERHAISHRQARRYIRAVRRIYSQHASEDALSIDEMLALLLARSDAALAGDEPDYKASIKALEQYARMRGWLDKRSTVTVTGSLTVAHTHALDGASDAEIAALQAYHAARALREASGTDAGVVDSTAEELAPVGGAGSVVAVDDVE